MKQFQQFVAVAALALGLATNASAQTDTTSPTIKRTSDGRILQPDAAPSPSAGITTPRPDRAERALPPEIREKLKQFEVAREVYIKQQEELRRKLDGATTEQERENIRLRLKESLERWREQARQFREEARERVRELQIQMPSLREALDESKPRTPGKPGRPGTD